MKFIKFIMLSYVIVSVLGCASSGILKTGDDKYIISKTDVKLGFGPPTAAHASITREAVDYCDKKNKIMEVTKTELRNPYFGTPGSATLEFRCSDE